MVSFMRLLNELTDISLYPVVHMTAFDSSFQYDSPGALNELMTYCKYINKWHGLIGRAGVCYAGGRVQSQAATTTFGQVVPAASLPGARHYGIELGKSTCRTTSGLTPAVVFTAYAAAWPKVIETGIGTALMRHLARKEIYYFSYKSEGCPG